MTATSRPALLDVNVLVALFDPDHVHHDIAHDWFADNRGDGWATCPLTENGVVRILSNLRYSPTAESSARIVERLRATCDNGNHVFWADDLSLRDVRRFVAAAPISHRQVTDVYLLGLARRHRGRLATFDRTIPLEAVPGGERDDLIVISE
ncbi:MAG: PIN domain-containing protein [Acidobacteria bacterium]|nr:PIN domain-containing protein [Acidobacteriota bacterium]